MWFHIDRRYNDGGFLECVVVKRSRERAYYAANPEKYRAKERRVRARKRRAK